MVDVDSPHREPGDTTTAATDLVPNGTRVVRAHPRVDRRGQCSCCQLAFTFTARLSAGIPMWCSSCERHFPTTDEPITRRLSRMLDHEFLYRRHFHTVNRTVRRLKSALLESRAVQERLQTTCRRLVGLAAAVRSQHRPGPDGLCTCGTAWYPCATVEVLDRFEDETAARVAQEPGATVVSKTAPN